MKGSERAVVCSAAETNTDDLRQGSTSLADWGLWLLVTCMTKEVLLLLTSTAYQALPLKCCTATSITKRMSSISNMEINFYTSFTKLMCVTDFFKGMFQRLTRRNTFPPGLNWLSMKLTQAAQHRLFLRSHSECADTGQFWTRRFSLVFLPPHTQGEKKQLGLNLSNHSNYYAKDP